jgi:protocatechuate 3,4-dioxygenase beta subunit
MWRTLALTLVSLAAIVALLVWALGQDERPAEALPSAWRAEPPPEANGATAGGDARAGATGERAMERTGDAELQRLAAPARAPRSSGLEVRVVERDNAGAQARPVADVAVEVWFDAGAEPTREPREWLARALSESIWPAERGHTGPDGRVWFQPRTSDVLAIARSADGRASWGTVLETDGVPLELTLRPNFDVNVRVLDVNAAPAHGAPLVLRRIRRLADFRFAVDYLNASTDRAGRARLPNVGLVTARGGEWSIEVALPGLERVAVPAPSQASEFELRLPPCGRVELSLTRGGQALREGAFEVSLYDGRDELNAGNERHGPLSGSARQRARDGVSRFEYVPLGRELVARAWSAAVQHEVRFAGPTRPGETARVELALDGGSHWRGRVLDARGRPHCGALLVRAEFGAELEEQREELDAWADERGAFAVLLAHLPHSALPRSVVIARKAADGSELDAAHALVPAGAEDVDLGEVVLRPVPTLASGVVVDHLGAPVSGARVALVESAAEHFPLSRGRCSTITDDAGRFELRYALHEREVSLLASAGWRSSRRWTGPAGAREVRLEFGWSGALRGRFVGDCWTGPRMLLVPSGESFDSQNCREITAAKDGVWGVVGLSAGVWDLVAADFGFLGQPVELGRRPAIAHLDESVNEIDLGEVTRCGLVEVLRVKVELAPAALRSLGDGVVFQGIPRGGRPLVSGSFKIRGSKWSAARSELEPVRHSGDTLVLPARYAPFDVEYADYFVLPNIALNVQRDTTIQVDLKPRYSVQLAPNTPHLPRGLAYFLEVAWVDGSDTTARRWFGDELRQVDALPRGGAARLRVGIAHRSLGYMDGWNGPDEPVPEDRAVLVEHEPLELTIAPNEAREFELAPSQAALEAAIAAVRQRVRGG